MKYFVVVIYIFFGYLFPAAAKPDPDRRKLDEIFAAATNAVGTAKEIAKIRSIEAVAECVGPKGKYRTSIVSFRKDKTYFAQTYSYRDKHLNIFINGDLVWERQDGRENTASSPLQRMVARAHEYQKMAFDFEKFFTDFELIGDEEFAGRASVKVRAKNELDMTTFLYFDKATKRFNGYVLEIGESTETVRNVFAEWRRAGKLTLPSVVKATDKEGEWVLSFNTIKLNAADEKLLDVPPRVADMAELMSLHEQQKAAHLTYNADLFVDMFAENLTQIQRGNAVTRTKAENLARFKAYFASFKFLEWADITPPLIKISKDGTMATIIVHKRVRGTYKNDKGEDVSDNTIFAWLEVWEKVAGKWKVTTIASTDKPGGN